MANLYRDLTKILSKAGFEYLRPGKGDHEVWQNIVTGKRVVVDRSLYSRYTANGVLKQAGLLKAF